MGTSPGPIAAGPACSADACTADVTAAATPTVFRKSRRETSPLSSDIREGYPPSRVSAMAGKRLYGPRNDFRAAKLHAADFCEFFADRDGPHPAYPRTRHWCLCSGAHKE